MSKSKESFLKHSLIYGVGTILTQAAGLLLLPIYTCYMSPSDYGEMEVLNRLGEVLVICLLGQGLRQATLTFFRQARDEVERRRVASTVIVTFIAFGLFGVFVLALQAEFLSGLLGIGRPSLLCLALVAMFLEALTAIPLALIQARTESGPFVLASLSQLLLRIGLVILFVVGLDWGIWGVITASVITSGLFALLLCGRELARGLHFDTKMLPAILGFTLPFLPGGLSLFLMNAGDRFFLLHYGGADAVGIYSLGYKLATVVTTLSVTPLYMVWCVRMYDVAEEPEGPQAFGRAFTRILGVYIAAGLALSLLQEEVVRVLGGRRFAGGASVIAPVVLAYGFLAAANLMDAGFYVRRRTGLKAWISAAASVAMLGLYALLIRPLGANGAALATLVGFTIQAVLTYALSQRIFPVRYEWGRLAGMVCLAAVLWSAGRLLPIGGSAIAAKALLWAVWPAALWATNLVRPEEKLWFRSAVRWAADPLRSSSRRQIQAEASPVFGTGRRL